MDCGGSNNYRVRSCDKPVPSEDGIDCRGESNRTRECNVMPCPGKHTVQCRNDLVGHFENSLQFLEAGVTGQGGRHVMSPVRQGSCHNRGPVIAQSQSSTANSKVFKPFKLH